jgi:transcriptional regulator with XRE-family HTH domain
MNEVRSLRERAGVTQAALAKAAGTSQPTIAAYEAGQKSPTLDTVHRLARSVGYEMTMEFFPVPTREERRSLALHRAIAQRLSTDPRRTLDRARATLARMRESQLGAERLLREWEVLLSRPVEALLPVLTDPSPWARELRQVTPFAGILTAAERASVYRTFAEQEERPA